MAELQVMVSQEVGQIHFNYEEIKASLETQMSAYEGAVFTEESKNVAKAEVAALRKMKQAINTKCKEVKAQCMVPYQDFEKKAKELMELIDKPIALIDGQVKAFEEKRREEKKENIKKVYLEVVMDDIREYMPMEKIYDCKWENASRSMKSIREEICSIANSTRMAVQTISSMTSESVPRALEIYKQTMDLAKAIAHVNNYEAQRAEILRKEEERRRQEEERKRQEELERARAEERRRVAEEERIREEARRQAETELRTKKEREEQRASDDPEDTEKNISFDTKQSQEEDTPFETGGDPVSTEDDLPFLQPSTIRVTYTVIATPEELEQVEMLFNSIGICFERRNG
ncbi:MAG: DUF1351 domain-containing protein [Blautia sp.]|nr:DUF1351 domain-containing protein [Blautia sp.]